MEIKTKTKTVYYKEDTSRMIEYTIRYYREQNAFKVFKNELNDDRKPIHSYTIRTKSIVDFKEDLDNLKEYINEELIGEKRKMGRGSTFQSQSQSTDEGWIDYMPIKKKATKTHNQNDDEGWADPKSKKRTMRRSSLSIDNYQINPPCQLEDLKTKDLETLFLEWEKAQDNEPEWLWKITNGGNNNIGKSHFRRDGIIDEDTFRSEATKVLFISAEANDNNYSAITQPKTNTVLDYREYYRTGIDDYGGNMKEMLAEMFKIICGIERNSLANNEAVMRFAVMDINKRGGGSSIGNGNHLKAYCKYYAPFIRKEIEIIDPDIVAIVGVRLYGFGLHEKYLGAIPRNGKSYLNLSGKMVPILSLYQTSSYQTRREPLSGYEENRTKGKQAARCAEELYKYGISTNKKE